MSERRRLTLQNRRGAENFELRHGGKNTTFTITMGNYPDGTIGEVFISGPKSGSEVDAVARDGAILLSLALQHGVPLETIRHAMTREPDGRASTIVGAVVDEISRKDKGGTT
jgi:hypothetical protein